MRFSNLTEYSRQVTANNLGDRLIGAASKDTTIGEVSTTDDILSKLEDGDPTKNKKYSQWIARVYAQGGYKYEDVSSVVADGLAKFDKLKNQKIIVGTDADIGRYPDFDKFLDFVNSHDEPVEKQKQDRGNFEVVYSDKRALLIHPKDETAAKFWGQSTKWCTAANKNNKFNDYSDGLRILIPKKPQYKGEKYQFMLQTHRFDHGETYLELVSAADNEASESIETTNRIYNRFSNIFRNYLLKELKGYVILDDLSDYNGWLPIHLWLVKSKGIQAKTDKGQIISNDEKDIKQARDLLVKIGRRRDHAEKKGGGYPQTTYDFDRNTDGTSINKFDKYYHIKKSISENVDINEEAAAQIYTDLRVSSESQSMILGLIKDSFVGIKDSYSNFVKSIGDNLSTEYPEYTPRTIKKVQNAITNKLNIDVETLYAQVNQKINKDPLHITLFAPQQRNAHGVYDNTDRYDSTIDAIRKLSIEPQPGREGAPMDPRLPDTEQKYKDVYKLTNPITIKNWTINRLDKQNQTIIFLTPDKSDENYKKFNREIRERLKKIAGGLEYSTGSFLPHIELFNFFTGNLMPSKKDKFFPLPPLKDPTRQIKPKSIGPRISPASQPERDYDDSQGTSGLSGLSTRQGSLINILSRRIQNLFIKSFKENFQNISVTFDRIGIQKSSRGMVDIERPEKKEDFLRGAKLDNLQRFLIVNRRKPNEIYGGSTTLPNGQVVKNGVPGFSEKDVRTRWASKLNVQPQDIEVKPYQPYGRPEIKKQNFEKFTISDRLNNSQTLGQQRRIQISLQRDGGKGSPVPTIFDRRSKIKGNHPRVQQYEINSGNDYWEPTFVTVYSSPEGNPSRKLKTIPVTKTIDYGPGIGYEYSFTDTGIPGGRKIIFDQVYGWKDSDQRVKPTQPTQPTQPTMPERNEGNNTPLKESSIDQQKIYVDMDGVVADFHTDFQKFGGDIKELAATDPITIFKLYRNLRPLADGVKLVKYLQDNNIQFTFLSAPLRKRTKTDSSGSEASKLAKVEWLKQHFPGMENNVEFTSEKSKFAGGGNILIDDREVFLGPWKEAGGTGILYHDYSSAVSELEKLLSVNDKELSEAIRQETQSDLQRQSMFITWLKRLVRKPELTYEQQIRVMRLAYGFTTECNASNDIARELKKLSNKTNSTAFKAALDRWISQVPPKKRQRTNSFKFNESSKYLGPTTKVKINKKGMQTPLNKQGFGA